MLKEIHLAGPDVAVKTHDENRKVRKFKELLALRVFSKTPY